MNRKIHAHNVTIDYTPATPQSVERFRVRAADGRTWTVVQTGPMTDVTRFSGPGQPRTIPAWIERRTEEGYPVDLWLGIVANESFYTVRLPDGKVVEVRRVPDCEAPL